MGFDYTKISATGLGKFISGAFSVNRDLLKQVDLSNVNVSIAIDGTPVDVVSVFSVFDAPAEPEVPTPPTGAPAGSGAGIFISADQVEAIRSHLSQSNSELHSINSRVHEAFNDAVYACSTEAHDLSENVESRVSEAGNHYALGDDVAADAFSGIHDVAEILGIAI